MADELFAPERRIWHNADCGARIVWASFECLQLIVATHLALAFVWPDEGQFRPCGHFQFNEDHAGFEPLLVDPTTAQAVTVVFDALQKDANREKAQAWIGKDRGHFGAMVNFCWSKVRPAGWPAAQGSA